MKRINFFYKLLLLTFTTSMFAQGIIFPIYAIFVQKIGGDILARSTALARAAFRLKTSKITSANVA